MRIKNYQLFLPLNYEVIIPENDSIRLLSQIIEELDYTELNMGYSREGRKAATNPKILTNAIIYAYMESVYSTRKIENACRRDINFMWLLNGEPVPDHSIISRFRRNRLGKAIQWLFCQFIHKLCELGEVNYKDVFIDGTKIESAANRYAFVWKKAVEKNEAKMLLKGQELSEPFSKNVKSPMKILPPKKVLYCATIYSYQNTYDGWLGLGSKLSSISIAGEVNIRCRLATHNSELPHIKLQFIASRKSTKNTSP